MKTDIRLVSATILQEVNVETIDGLDFSTIENSGEIEIIVELANDEKSEFVSKVVSDFNIFKQEIEAFEKE